MKQKTGAIIAGAVHENCPRISCHRIWFAGLFQVNGKYAAYSPYHDWALDEISIDYSVLPPKVGFSGIQGKKVNLRDA